MTADQIASAIKGGFYTNAELDSILMSVRYARSQLQKIVKRSLRPGDTVRFDDRRQNQTYTGTVEKIAIKYITIRVGNRLWKVPANMLEGV